MQLFSYIFDTQAVLKCLKIRKIVSRFSFLHNKKSNYKINGKINSFSIFKNILGSTYYTFTLKNYKYCLIVQDLLVVSHYCTFMLLNVSAF